MKSKPDPGTPQKNPSRWIPTRAMAVKIALSYAVLGALWILWSGWVLHHFAHNQELEATIETVKGWFFVAVTALLLGLALERYFRHIRQAARLLQESEERWQFALEGAGQGVWDWNAVTNEVFYSPRWKAMLGFEPHEIGHNLAEWESRVHPDDLPRVRVEIQRHLDGQTPAYASEHRIRCRDGSWKWVLDQGQVMTRTADGKPLRILGTHFDVTGRKQADEARRQSEEEFRFIFELASIGMAQADPRTGRWLRVNQKMCAITGYPAEEMLRMQIRDLTHPEDRQRDWDLFQQVVRGEVSEYRTEKRYVRRDGLTVWVNVNMTLIRDAAGQPLRSLATIEDITERRRAEEQLRQLSRAVEQSPASIVITDTQGTIEYVNPKFTATTGYAPEEILGRNPRVLKSGNMAPGGYRELWETILAGREWRGELCNRRKNGELYWELASISPITDAAGRITHFVAVKEDITGRKLAAEALQRSEERYRGLVETTFDWIWEVDAQGRYTYVSPKVKELLGYTPEEVLGRTPFELMPEEEAQRISAVFLEVAARREPFSALENVNRHKDGRLVVLESSGVPVLGADGEFRGYRGMDRDITARKEAEAALKASEERFRQVIQTAPEAIFIRTNHRFAYLNAAAVKLFGAASAEDLLGQPVLDRFHSQARAQILERIRRLDEQQEPTTTADQVFLRLDGKPVNVIVSAVPFTYLGQPSALVFARDMTEHRRLEIELRQAQKLEAVGQLAGGVAHDFNNMLAATMMHLSLLQMNEAIDPETREALKELEQVAQREATLTRQLLMFSRRSVLAVKPLDLNDVVANLLKMLNRLIGEHITLRFDGRSGLPEVEADAGMMEQVIMNLVVNARDAMPQGGRITIGTAELSITNQPEPGGEGRRPGHFVCLLVADTGCGMDAATVKRIFEPFFTTKEAGKGTGLGLATVHGIVAQHQGWVEVESAVGSGTTFRMFLPALERSREEAAPARLDEPLQRGKETILVVEDDEQVRRLVAQSLQVLGYRVYEAANGQEAMRLWQAHRAEVDLLLTDMVMPEGMTGLELTERLQALKPGLQAIISSGYSAEIVQAGVPTKAGVAYLPKPYQTNVLAETVRNCLDRRP